MFSEKLDFLMGLTNSLNSTLAQAISVDASLISRLRSGNRKLPKKATFTLAMSEYFASKIVDKFQIKTICEILHLKKGWPKSQDEATQIIYNWLFNDKLALTTEISNFLSGISKTKKVSKLEPIDFDETISSYEENNFYYGNDGKRRAVIRLLTEIAKESVPQTILVYSDEDMSWFNEDLTFTKLWTQLILDIIKKGNKIKVIHNLNSDANEILKVLTRWLPLYMTGSITPYYFPKLRDGIFQNSLFIAPNTASIISSSVKNNTNNMLNVYLTDDQAIEATKKEFERYFDMCTPLTTVTNKTNNFNFFNDYLNFQKFKANTILFSPVASPIITPNTIANAFGKNFPEYLNLWENSIIAFKELIKTHTYTEILISRKDTSKNNSKTSSSTSKNKSSKNDVVNIPMCDMLFSDNLHITMKDYKRIITNAKRMSREKANFTFLTKESDLNDVIIYIKEDVGAIVAKASSPTTIFTFNEPILISAIWSYLSNMVKDLKKRR